MMNFSIASIAATALFISTGAAVSVEMPRSYDEAAAAEHCKNYATPHADGRAKGVLYQAVYDMSGKRIGRKPMYSAVRQNGKIIGYNPSCGGHG